MAVVKADGFGHGALDVARTALAHGATRLGVTSLDEAWPLRDAGLAVPVLSWLNPVDADFESADGTRHRRRGADLAAPRRHRRGRPGRSRVHLHVDAGMARDGAGPRLLDPRCAAPHDGPSCAARSRSSA